MLSTHHIITVVVVALIPVALEASVETMDNARDFPIDSSQRVVPMKQCARGSSTVLGLGGLTKSEHHDGNDGEAHFRLRQKGSGRPVWKDELIGEGVCYGYNPRKKIFIIGTIYEHGVGVRLMKIGYLDEARHSLRLSIFTRKGLEALAAVPSKDFRYLALIATDGNDTSLYLLDTNTDSIKNLGKAPLPPPLNERERTFIQRNPSAAEGRWDWMGQLRDSYMKLDPGVLFFRQNTLNATYGRDTRFKRAKRRHLKVYYLGDKAKP